MPFENRAPLFVLSDRHSAFDADPDSLDGFTAFPPEQLLDKGHFFLPRSVYTQGNSSLFHRSVRFVDGNGQDY